MTALCTLLPDSPSLLPDTPVLYPDGWDCSGVGGGGGFGAVMGDAFFKRYEPRYKPTLRKQK